MKLPGVLIESKTNSQASSQTTAQTNTHSNSQVHDQSGGSRRQVLLKHLGSRLVVTPIDSDAEILVIDVNSLDFQRGGNRGGLLFLSSPCLQGFTLYVDDEKNSRQFFEENKALQSKIRCASPSSLYGPFAWILGLGLLFGLFGGLIVFRGPIFGGLGSMIPFSWEQTIGDRIFTQKLTEKQSALNSELNQLVKVLHFEPEVWNKPFRLHISSSPELNAYATVGGHVFINRGLILEFTRPEQLLGVIAHEMIHVQRRHVVRSIFQGLGLFTLIQLFFGDVSGLIAIAIDQGGPLLNLQYSRELESEADSLGLQLLARNQIDPRGLPEGLQVMANQMQKLKNQQPGQEATGEILKQIEKLELFNSHPELNKRIENLMSRSGELSHGQEFKSFNFDYVRFRSLVKENF
jgi:Zn-dependent protease with chaperone function